MGFRVVGSTGEPARAERASARNRAQTPWRGRPPLAAPPLGDRPQPLAGAVLLPHVPEDRDHRLGRRRARQGRAGRAARHATETARPPGRRFGSGLPIITVLGWRRLGERVAGKTVLVTLAVLRRDGQRSPLALPIGRLSPLTDLVRPCETGHALRLMKDRWHIRSTSADEGSRLASTTSSVASASANASTAAPCIARWSRSRGSSSRSTSSRGAWATSATR